MKRSGNTILVTGGGSGIGRALARELAAAGNKVIVAGRRAEALAELTSDSPAITAMAMDIADPGSIMASAACLLADNPNLNVVINNAGIMLPEDGIDPAVADVTIATNLLGPIRLTAALLPHLEMQADAAIINVSSALAFVPFAATPTYCATKAALHSWTVSLRHQLRRKRVEVIEIIPPAVQTELLPGQSSDPHAMPLDAYVADTMAQLRRQPTPPEICAEPTLALSSVVDADRFAQVFGAFNG